MNLWTLYIKKKKKENFGAHWMDVGFIFLTCHLDYLNTSQLSASTSILRLLDEIPLFTGCFCFLSFQSIFVMST